MTGSNTDQGAVNRFNRYSLKSNSESCAKFIKKTYKAYIPSIQCSDQECLNSGTIIQKMFWDFNDTQAKRHGFHKLRNMVVFLTYLWSSVPQKNIKKFVQRFTQLNSAIPVAGFLLFNSDRSKILLVKNVGSPSWSFPKGKVEMDESYLDCALRECKEETSFIPDPSTIDHSIHHIVFGKRQAYFFVVNNVPEDFTFIPENSHEIASVKWHNVSPDLLSRSYNIYVNRMLIKLKICSP